MTAGYWGSQARDHWRRHLPSRYAALEDPKVFFEALGAEATAYYLSIREELLEGLDPNEGTISWAEFVVKVDQANQAAREIVAAELIYLPGVEDIPS